MKRGHRPTRATTLIALSTLGVLLLCPCVFALDPSLDISQYSHTSWKVRDGFSKGYLDAMAQTPDGYLWLGTEFGLLRFDGVRAVPWQPPNNQRLPSNFVRSLLAARDGALWIGTAKGLASSKDGKLTHYPEIARLVVDGLLEDREGTVWAAGFDGTNRGGRLCAIQRGRVQCYGEDGSLGSGVSSLYEDSKGNLWASAQAGLLRWKPGPPSLFSMRDLVSTSETLIEGDNGALLIATRIGIRQLIEGKTEPYPIPGVGQQFSPDKLLLDRSGGLWIGTRDRGIFHVHNGKTDVFGQADGLSGDSIERLFEDQEGNIWVATIGGLDRFRDFAIPTVSVKQGLSSAAVWSVLAAKDGSVWLGTVNGLNRWKDGQITIYRKRSTPVTTGGAKREAGWNVREVTGSALQKPPVSLFEDSRGRIWVTTLHGIVYFENGRFFPITSMPDGTGYSIAEDALGDLWINHDKGFFHLGGGMMAEQIPWAKLGREEAALSLVADPVQGGLWLGFAQGGLLYFKGGQVRASYAAAEGLGEGRVDHLRFGSRGTLWAATEGGLSRIKDGKIATLTSKNGLPCDTVISVMEDDSRAMWLYMACGLVRIARPELDAWVTDPKRAIQTTVYDSSDGVRSRAATGGYSPRVAKTADGKLWFLPSDGVSVIDPHHLPFNKLPPPVHIEQITADHKTYDATSDANGQVRVPPRVRDLEIDYTALSLVAPEKVLFRYKLEGWDRDWQDAGTRRQAFYSNLPPRSYTFRVKACNNSGVWNEAGTFLNFSVAPAYYQTWWFRSLCVASFLGLLAAAYQMRLRQVAHQFNIRLEERVSERTRIARDLHDTLLQSFQGVLLKFHAVTYVILDRPAEAQKTLESVIEQARQAITEGRDAVQGLRSFTLATSDIAQAISTFGEELATTSTGQNSPDFHVLVEGVPRDLAPLLRDEIYRITGEALRNAFRHAHAQRIEVEIRYDQRQLRLRVRDNGKGIDAAVLNGGGRPGHYGLPGMHERAKLMGGKLAVWSELNSGTEAELTIPASVAYAKSSAARRSMFWGKSA